MTHLLMFLFLFDDTPAKQFEEQRLQYLLGLKRVYIDKLTGENSDQIRDMLMNSLQTAQLFIVTENPEKADATIKGTAEDLIYTDKFQSSEGISARTTASIGARGSGSTARRSASSGISVSDRESINISERKHEARVSLRMVNRDGDVIWSTTQESGGAKFKGASADVADKVSRKLAEDFDKARKTATERKAAPPEPPPAVPRSPE